MFRKLITAAALTLITAAGAAHAKAPWEGKQPKGMQAAHMEMAKQAKKFADRNGAGSLGRDPLDTKWRWDSHRQAKEPMSNMTTANLRRLLMGNYVIMSSNRKGVKDSWDIGYFAPDGKTYFCSNTRRGIKEWTLTHYFGKSKFGASGYFHWDPEQEKARKPSSDSLAWPTVYNSSTGAFSIYSYVKKKWVPGSGWVQKEYPNFLQEHCPNLPRKSKVNNVQRGLTLTEIAKGANPIRGVQVAFQNDVRIPLTAGMYYWAYPPVKK
jgi:hypothetical protein